MPAAKEPHYFVEQGGLSTLQDYQALFRGAGLQAEVGEASTGYLYAPEAPERISGLLVRPKIIIILRNPIDLAYSLYWHMVRVGGEALPFEEALDAEGQRFEDLSFRQNCFDWYPNYFYTRRATFHPQIDRYFCLFGRANVHVELFEDLADNARLVCARTFTFLGVDASFTPMTSEIHNAAGRTISRRLDRLVNRKYPAKAVLRALIPARRRLALADMVNRVNRANAEYPQMGSDTRERLRETFAEDIWATSALIGRDLSHWM